MLGEAQSRPRETSQGFDRIGNAERNRNQRIFEWWENSSQNVKARLCLQTISPEDVLL